MAGEAPVRLILASASATRREMLETAGLSFKCVPATVDEAAIRDGLTRKDSVRPADIAVSLAAAKAENVSRSNADALVIGSDQILALGGEIINKVATREAARLKLQRLRGRVHELHSAVALARGGAVLWTAVDTAQLTMRDFDDRFLDAYLDKAGEDIHSCVGCYRIEGLGVRLFETIEGSHFTILGMPLLPLLSELRRLGAVI